LTRTQKILAWASLLASAFALRIGLAVSLPNICYPDEIFQTLEPAHRLVYGYGVISWEWRLGIRSWVFPTFLACVMRATQWMGAASSGYLLGTQTVLSLLSLVTVWFGYAWARRASETPAAVLAALACAFYFAPVYFAPKAFYEVVAAHILLPGLYLGVYGDRISERKRFFFAGVFLALAACLRMQLLPAVLFAAIYFCYRHWRSRGPALTAGFALPVLFFGLVDWMTWSYPWQSFVRSFQTNLLGGPGKEISAHQAWWWYAVALFVLLGPAILGLFHGVRRSPFLAVFCAIVVVSHSFIPHKELRYIYPIVAPALTLAAMGMVDLLKEVLPGAMFAARPRWVLAIGVAFFAASSAVVTMECKKLYTTPWGAVAFDRISQRPDLCGVGVYGVIWYNSGGYTHLHRPVPLYQLLSADALAQDAGSFNALIAPDNTPALPSAFKQTECWQGVCLYERTGSCTAPHATQELNAFLRSVGR
jgi:hypothetical protein